MSLTSTSLTERDDLVAALLADEPSRFNHSLNQDIQESISEELNVCNGWNISNRRLGPLMMSFLIPLAIIAFFCAPFAVSGFRRNWRAATTILMLLAFYTGYVWLRRLPAEMQETDRLGAAAWSMILLILLAATTAAICDEILPNRVPVPTTIAS
jgi:hypothetical protein